MSVHLLRDLAVCPVSDAMCPEREPELIYHRASAVSRQAGQAHRSDEEARRRDAAEPCPAGEGEPCLEVLEGALLAGEGVLLDVVEVERSWTSKDC